MDLVPHISLTQVESGEVERKKERAAYGKERCEEGGQGELGRR